MPVRAPLTEGSLTRKSVPQHYSRSHPQALLENPHSYHGAPWEVTLLTLPPTNDGLTAPQKTYVGAYFCICSVMHPHRSQVHSPLYLINFTLASLSSSALAQYASLTPSSHLVPHPTKVVSPSTSDRKDFLVILYDTCN